MQFKITGAYSFADTYDVMQPSDGVIARAGRLTGAWRLESSDGRSGNVHINAATAVRFVPNEAPALLGTMVLNMFEYEGSEPGTDVLYLAYEASNFQQPGLSQQIITVEGRFVGGRGRYAGATGSLHVVSVNGFIQDGVAEVHLPPQSEAGHPQPLSPDQVRAAVAHYFEGTRSGDATRWASAFATNAVVEDPIGQPALTNAQAILAQGEAFLSAFSSVGLHEKFVEVNGHEAVAYWEGQGATFDGQAVRFSGINQFRFDANGKVISLRGFWNPDDIQPA
ncbi:MAG: nuclear transport factor 2 family protein [Cyanobacteria bacterium J06639_14]